jgi:hypothetical protein
MTEVRSFNCSNGNPLLLVKDGNHLTLNKLTEKGNWEKVAEKQYAEWERCPDIKNKTALRIVRKGFDSDGKEIRRSYIPVTSLTPSAPFKIEDGKTTIAGRLWMGRKKEIKLFENVETEINLGTMGNLAKRYLKKEIEFCSKVK